jgi:hypothetical protein
VDALGIEAELTRGWCHHEVVDVDDLYGLPLDEFVPARNGLARELRNSGRRDDAGEVAALRKPSVAAWAVNQLVRTQKGAVGELFDAGDALRGAHEGVLAGRGGGGELREAVERERSAVDALTVAARGLLTSQGHELSQTIIDRVADTLHAAALDDDARSQVTDGRLERELRHVGLGLAAAGTLPAPARRPPRAPSGGGRRAGDPVAAEKRAERERAERERAEARAEARAGEREARRRVDRAERAVTGAVERRDRAAKALDAAQAELSDAETELDEAREQLGAAEEALRELGR